MRYDEFKKCIEVYGVPAAHRNNCREFRINPMVTTNGYEEVYLPADPASKLSQWMERAFAAFVVFSFVVVDAVGDVALLLDFAENDADADGVNGAGRNVNRIAAPGEEASHEPIAKRKRAERLAVRFDDFIAIRGHLTAETVGKIGE